MENNTSSTYCVICVCWTQVLICISIFFSFFVYQAKEAKSISGELKYADSKSKSFRKFTFQFSQAAFKYYKDSKVNEYTHQFLKILFIFYSPSPCAIFWLNTLAWDTLSFLLMMAWIKKCTLCWNRIHQTYSPPPSNAYVFMWYSSVKLC